MVKILTVVLNLEKGGTQRAAQNFCEAYKGLGHDSRVLAMGGGGPRVEEIENVGILVWQGLRGSLDSIISWVPDIVHLHSHGLNNADVETLMLGLVQSKFVETNVFSAPTAWEERLAVSFQLSEWCLFLYRYRGGASAKSVVVPNPVKCSTMFKVDTGATDVFKTRHGIPRNKFIVGRIGQALPRKWSVALIDLFERFLRDTDDAVHLVICNPPPNILNLLDSNPGLSARTTVIDSIIGDDELRLFYNSLDLMLHIADVGESFGMVLSESLLCETPVLTLNTPWGDNAQGEITGYGIGGFAANTVNELYESLLMFYHRQSVRIDAGKKGREYILSQYDMLKVAEKAISSFAYINPPPLNFRALLRYTHNDWSTRLLLWLMYLSKRDRVGIFARKVFMARSGLPKSAVKAIPSML